MILNPLEDVQKEYPQEKRVSIAARNARRLYRLVNQLLDFQKIAAGKKNLQLERINMCKFLYSCAESFESVCRQKNVEFRYEIQGVLVTELPEDRIFIDGDLDALEKITFNYLYKCLGSKHIRVRVGPFSLIRSNTQSSRVTISIRERKSATTQTSSINISC